MKNNFDKAIKKALENYEESNQAMNWDRMEKAIEEEAVLQPKLDDLYLDGMVYDSLHNLDVQYNPAHWDLMNEKLADPFALRQRMMKYKVAEVALVLLFIFALIQFLPFKQVQHDIADRNFVPPTNFSNSSPNQIDPLTTISTEAENTEIANSKEDINASIKADMNADMNAGKVKNENGNSASNNNKQSVKLFDSANLLTNVQEVEETKLVADAEAPKEDNAKQIENGDPIISENPDNTSALTLLLDPIALKEDKMVIPGVEEISGSNVFSDLKQPIKIRIGMVMGPDANYVMTSADASKGLASFDQFALGYSGGFSLGFNYNKWEIESGVLYSSVTYDSRNIFEIKGSFAQGGYVQQGFEGAELDLIRLPLNVRYNFFEKKKWNIYVYTGASLNMAVETFYNFTTKDVGQSDASRNFAAPSPRIPDEFEDQFQNDSYDGIFEGGNFSKNSFLTANIGFGIEKYFTPRFSVFLQPGYMHQISKGHGPQDDQINSLSILTGAKVTLKKRKKIK